MRYHRLGDLPKKHHIAFRKPDGGLYTEQLFGTEGFSGPMSTLYHINMPTEVSSWEDVGDIRPKLLTDEALRGQLQKFVDGFAVFVEQHPRPKR